MVEAYVDEYEKLLEEVEREVRARQELHWRDLLKWGEERGVGPVTLSLFIEELQRRGVIEASSDRELADEHLGIYLPVKVHLKLKQPERTPTTRAGRGVRRAPGRDLRERGALLKYLFEGEEARAEAQAAPPPAPVPQEFKTPSVAQVQPLDSELVTVLQYLHRYLSVGELRLISDVKSLGVKNPEDLLRKLIEEGVVTVVDPGVVNANREEVEKRIKALGGVKPSQKITDLFR